MAPPMVRDSTAIIRMAMTMETRIRTDVQTTGLAPNSMMMSRRSQLSSRTMNRTDGRNTRIRRADTAGPTRRRIGQADGPAATSTPAPISNMDRPVGSAIGIRLPS